MPRIRTIKPEFPEDETLGAVSRDARLLFILIWTRADDYGRFRASPAYLRGQLYPFDEDVTNEMVASWLKELEGVGRVQGYVVRDEHYAVVSNWARHQRVDNAGKSLCPSPPFAEESASLRDSRSEAKPSQINGESHRRPPLPKPAESRGGSPLDHDHDPDRDQDHDHEGARTNAGRDRPKSGDPQVVVEDPISEALDELARRDLAAAEASGQKILSRGGLYRRLRQDRERIDGGLIRALHVTDPKRSGSSIANEVAPRPPQPAEYVPDAERGDRD